MHARVHRAGPAGPRVRQDARVPALPPPVLRRFVALGDSTTEGVGDPWDPGREATSPLRGWADRLAERLAALHPGLTYANLAVRGLKAAQIRERQLDAAVALAPDLVGMTGGLNDLLRPRLDLDAVLADLDAIQGTLTAAGATVLTFTLPDLSAVAPVARPVRGRLAAYNDGLRALHARHGSVLVDAAVQPVGEDPRLWASDRLHPNAEGHARLADAAAEALRLPGASDAWTRGLHAAEPAPLPRALARETAWTVRFLAPWVGRRLRGASSGDGREAKRPVPGAPGEPPSARP